MASERILKVVRVITYEGPESWVKATLEKSQPVGVSQWTPCLKIEQLPTEVIEDNKGAFTAVKEFCRGF